MDIKHKRPLEDMDTSNTGKWPCLMYGESFAQRRPREVWIQCQSYKTTTTTTKHTQKRANDTVPRDILRSLAQTANPNFPKMIKSKPSI